jgi:hypothetical protein
MGQTNEVSMAERARAGRGGVMNATERKRAWRLRHPEASQTAERERAQARRDGYWGSVEAGSVPRRCASHDSYWRYESTVKRMKQRMFWPHYGAGTTRMTREELRAAGAAITAARIAEIEAEIARDVESTPELAAPMAAMVARWREMRGAR